MFRHDIREKPVLYKEILKAISKRELLEDLCFCACRKDHLPGVYRCHSWQEDLLRYLSGFVGWPRSAHDATQVTPSVWCNGFATVKRLHRILALCAISFGITSACLPCSAFHPCKVSPRLRLHRATVHPASIQFQHLPS